MIKLFKISLIKIRSYLFRDFREISLANSISKIIIESNFDKNLYILDLGSGFDPKIIFFINDYLSRHNINVYIDCYDFYDEIQIKELNKIKSNIVFNNIKFLKEEGCKKKYNFGLVIDVLHHIGVQNKYEIDSALEPLVKKCDQIIIKDHFEYSIFSRILLRLSDFVGNYSYDVDIPKKYFDKKNFNQLILRNELYEIKRINNLRVIKKIWLFFSNPKMQFISILKKQI